LRFLISLIGTLMLFSWPVYADTVSIGIGTVPITVASGTGTASFDGPSGLFSTIHVTGTGQSLLASPDLLFSNTIDSLTAGSGAITIWITDQGLVAPLGTLPFTSGFTANLVPSGWTVVESTFVSMANALYGGTLLSSTSFSAIGTNSQTVNSATGAGPYSVSEEFVITAPGAGDANNTIDLNATPAPEPSILLLLAIGLISIGLMRGSPRFQ
jgi:hypothetical protein